MRKIGPDTPIDDIGFSFRTRNSLRRAHIDTFKDLMAAYEEGNLRSIKNLGKVQYGEILAIIDSLGYRKENKVISNPYIHSRGYHVPREIEKIPIDNMNLENRLRNVLYREGLLRIIRNYVMHAGDIMHGINVGTNGEFCVWTDVNVLIDDIRDSHDRCVLSNAGKRIDLIKLSNDSFPIILQIHEDFLEAVSDEKTVEALSILVSMQNKIMMYKSNIWFVFDYTGIEGVKPGLPIIGEIPGLGMNYRRLYWNVYKNLYDKLKKKEIMNS